MNLNGMENHIRKKANKVPRSPANILMSVTPYCSPIIKRVTFPLL